METPQKDEKPVSSTNTIENKSEPLFQVPQFHKILVPYDGSKMSNKAELCNILVKNFCF